MTARSYTLTYLASRRVPREVFPHAGPLNPPPRRSILEHLEGRVPSAPSKATGEYSTKVNPVPRPVSSSRRGRCQTTPRSHAPPGQSRIAGCTSDSARTVQTVTASGRDPLLLPSDAPTHRRTRFAHRSARVVELPGPATALRSAALPSRAKRTDASSAGNASEIWSSRSKPFWSTILEIIATSGRRRVSGVLGQSERFENPSLGRRLPCHL